MIDIVELLRSRGAFGMSGNLYERAADEIERLRRSLASEGKKPGSLGLGLGRDERGGDNG